MNTLPASAGLPEFCGQCAYIFPDGSCLQFRDVTVGPKSKACRMGRLPAPHAIHDQLILTDTSETRTEGEKR